MKKLSLIAAVALLLVIATSPVAMAKAGPAAGAAGSDSPLLATVDIGLGAGQHLDIDDAGAGVELALEAPRSWTYLADLARFAEDATWRLEMDVQGIVGGCVEPSVRLKTRVRGYQLPRGVNEAVKSSLIPYAARDCDPSRTARHVGGVFLTTDPLGYVDGPNLYQFALNNPVNYSDPMGLYVGETDPNKLKAQQLQIRLTGLRSEIARRAAAVEKRAHLNMLRQNLVDQVHPDEWVYTLAEWSHAAGMNLQDRAALQRAVFGPLGNCQTSMEQFTCAGASYTAGVGEIMDISLEIVLAVVPTVSISGAGGGIARGGINVAGHRSSLQALGRAARRDLYGRVPQTLSRSQQAFQKQLAFGRAKGIYPSGNDIALGVDDFLSDFAFQNNAWHWKYWEKVQLADRFADTGSGFELMFRQATMRTPRIHFNLQGMGNIRAAYQRGLLGVTKAPNNYTNAELAWILNDPDLLAKTTFHLNGRTVSGSLIHQLARP